MLALRCCVKNTSQIKILKQWGLVTIFRTYSPSGSELLPSSPSGRDQAVLRGLAGACGWGCWGCWWLLPMPPMTIMRGLMPDGARMDGRCPDLKNQAYTC